jgi:hypothetical protein
VRREARLSIKAVPASFSLAADKLLSCDGDQVTITANGADGLSYRWYVNGEMAPGQTTRTLATTLPDGANSLYATATNSGGCSATSAPITVNAWAVKTDVKMATAPTSECEVEDGEVDLYSYLSGSAGDLAALKDPNNAKQLKFRFEGMQVGCDGTGCHVASFASNPAKADGSPYALKFSVWQESVPGCVHTCERDVQVLARPKAFTIASNTAAACNAAAHVCNDEQVVISASSSNVANLTYAWQRNGNAIQGSQSSVIPSLQSGSNVFTVTATNAAGCSSASSGLEVIRHVFNPDVKFKASEFVYCANDPAVNLLGLLEGAGKAKALQQEDGITYTLATNPASGLYFNEATVEPYDIDLSRSTAREYLITFTASQNGCEVKRSAKLTINAVPANFSIAADKLLSCDGDKVTITTTGAEWLSYEWYINDDPMPNQTGKTLATALPDGSNSLYTIATNAYGCSISSDIITVDAWMVKTDVKMAVAPISECEVENGEIDLYDYLTGSAGDLELLKDPNNAKSLKFRFEGMQVGYNATAYHTASFANNPAKPDGRPTR